MLSDRNLYRLNGLAERHRVMLKVIQPFNSDLDADYLGWINRPRYETTRAERIAEASVGRRRLYS